MKLCTNLIIEKDKKRERHVLCTLIDNGMFVRLSMCSDGSRETLDSYFLTLKLLIGLGKVYNYFDIPR